LAEPEPGRLRSTNEPSVNVTTALIFCGRFRWLRDRRCGRFVNRSIRIVCDINAHDLVSSFISGGFIDYGA
jgi:hypothetical protein